MKFKATFCSLSLILLCGHASAGPFEPRMKAIAATLEDPRPVAFETAVFPHGFRSIDGSGNNLINPTWGAANTTLLRTTTNAYADGQSVPADSNQKGAREISNLVPAQDGLIPNANDVSDFVWQWGQFIDHDIGLTPSIEPAEPFDIPVPAGDPYFDPNNTGTQSIKLERSLYEMVNGVREQVNINTAYIDGSQIYGSDEARALELRLLDGSGKLKTSAGDLLPYNTEGFPNLPSTEGSFFLAGDLRANEQLGLTAMHTLFMREHNFWADFFRAEQPFLDDDGIYLRARAVVAAEIQIITYRDFLPLLLGKKPLAPYRGYQPQVNAGIANVFSSAAYRVGHTLLSPQLLRLDRDNRSIESGNISLADAFFNPYEISSIGIEPYLRGLARQRPQEVDAFIVDPVRNFLFGQPGQGGFDLAALNIQRGRDHGLPRYNEVRINHGLPPYATFAQMNPDTDIQARLAAAYSSPYDVDIWVGALAEKHKRGMMVSETTYTILKDQFERLRDGDRFWYEIYLPRMLVQMLEVQTLSDIIRRNTEIGGELQDDVFHLPRK
jgi:peroxidase